MELTFLGTGAATGVPLPFCRCGTCERARARGGVEIRRRSALCVDGGMVIDFGPDVPAFALSVGVDPSRLRYWLQTHPHADHLDAGHIVTRIPEYASEGVSPLTLLASEKTVKAISEALCAQEGVTLFDEAWLQKLNMEIVTAQDGREYRLGDYRVLALRAGHGLEGEALLYVVERGGAAFLYATDTPAPGEELFETLKAQGVALDAAIADHTYGPGAPGEQHMNADQCVALFERLDREGLLKKNARRIATHISHENLPPHRELCKYAARLGYEIAYDGMRLSL